MYFNKNNNSWNNFKPINSSNKIILYFGAHDFDIQITSGAAILALNDLGYKSFIVNFTLGEKVNNNMDSKEYRIIKEKDCIRSSNSLGVVIKNLDYRDAELYYSKEIIMEVVDEIRRIKPCIIITHWENSMHKDHILVNKIVKEAAFLVELKNIKTEYESHKIELILYTENWEDSKGFLPNIYIDVENHMDEWEKIVGGYDFLDKSLSLFPYVEYYKALARLRGIESGFGYAQCFMTEEKLKLCLSKGFHEPFVLANSGIVQR